MVEQLVEQPKVTESKPKDPVMDLGVTWNNVAQGISTDNILIPAIADIIANNYSEVAPGLKALRKEQVKEEAKTKSQTQ